MKKIIHAILTEKTPATESFRKRLAAIENRRTLLSDIHNRREALNASVEETRQAFFESSKPSDFETHVSAVAAFESYNSTFNGLHSTINTLNTVVSNDEAKPILLAAFKCVGDRLQSKVIALVSEQKAALEKSNIDPDQYAEHPAVSALRAALSEFREAQSKVASCQPEHCINLWQQLHGMLIAR